jgi:hypothetical protein
MANKSVGLLTIAFGADLRGFDKAMKKAQRSIKKFGTSMQRTGKNLTASLTLPLTAFAVASVRNFDKQQKAIAQVEAGLKSTGNTAGKTSIELQKMASDLQKKTLFGDEEILKNATAQLLTFTNIAGEQFDKTQAIALDLATRIDGDLKSASIMLGKALNDPVANLSALSRAGIQFSTDQKETIKSLVETNRLADAQTIILAELEKQYGGSAEAARKVGLGPLQALGMALSDVSEDFGELITNNIEPLTGLLEKLIDKLNKLTKTQKENILKWGAITAAVGPFLILIGKTFTSIAFLIPIIVRLGGAFKKLSILMFNLIKKNPWLLLATGIAAIGVAVADTLGAFDKWLGTEDEVQEETNKTTDTINELNEALLNVDKTITKVNKNKPSILPDLKFTPTQPLGEFMSPISEQFTEEMSLATEQFGEFGENLIFVSEKQKELNGITQLYGDVLFESMMTAANSQEGFFSSFIENIKKAVKQLLIQLAVMTAINILLGGKGMTIGKAFTAAKTSILGLASGGLVTGPTMALVGEGAGTTASNPEVVAPLDKLKGMLNGTGGVQQVEVYGRISGNDIFISNQRGGINRLRTV